MTGSGRWQDGTNFLLGVWLMVAPVAIYTTGGDGTAAWNSYVCGIAIMLLTAAALAWQWQGLEWISLAVGVWLLAAPWLIGFARTDGTAMATHLILGIIVGITALTAIGSDRLPNRTR